jgi:arsenite methyltransferase
MAEDVKGDQIRESVREHYAAAARQVKVVKPGSCCASSGASSDCCGGNSNGYTPAEMAALPQDAVLASLGCGNPTLLAELKPGETVLDLGSGGGIDVLLSAKRVGPEGKAYGLDMTDEMLELARANAKAAGVANVAFLKGQIESIPLPDASVDVIISNCVINLSADKGAVLAEAFRVLKPSGRFAVADIVVQGGPLPPAVLQVMALWAGCISGALGDEEYRKKLSSAGFESVEMETLKVYGREDMLEEAGTVLGSDLNLDPGTRIISAFIRARKPAGPSPR